MSLLIAMPQRQQPSELWLTRMNRALADQTTAIAAYFGGRASTVLSRKTNRGRGVPGVERTRAPGKHRAGTAAARTRAIRDNRCSATTSSDVETLDLLPRWLRMPSRCGLPVAALGAGSPRLRQAVQDPRVEVVLCHYVSFAVAHRAAWEGTDKPVFVHCHGYDVTWDLRLARWPHVRRFPPGYQDQVRRLASRVRFIANSRTTRTRLLSIGVPGERIVVNHLGVPVPRTCSGSQAGSERDAQILFLGRLVDCKGPDATIKAFDLACRRGLRGTLSIAGSGPLLSECRKLKRQSAFADRIRLLGAVDAATGGTLRREADIFTAHHCRGHHTLQQEALGVSLLEAMAAGLPVVTGRSGGVAESVIDGETGCLFEPGDLEAHAAALLQLAENPHLRGQLGRAGWKRVKDCFEAGRQTARLRSILGLPATEPALSVA